MPTGDRKLRKAWNCRGNIIHFFEISVIGEIPKNGPEIPQCFVFLFFFVCCCLKLLGDIFSMIKAPENDLFDHVDIYHVHYFSIMSPQQFLPRTNVVGWLLGQTL